MIKLNYLFLGILSAVTIIGTTSVASYVFAANSSPLGSPNNPITVQLISKELQNLSSALTGQLLNLQNNSQTTPSNNSSFQENIFNPNSNDTSNPSSFTSPHLFHSSNDQ